MNRTYFLDTSYIIALEIKNEDYHHLFNQGWEYFQKYQDKSYSFTDCLSFIIMTNYDILTALTLDNHFLQAGFQILP